MQELDRAAGPVSTQGSRPALDDGGFEKLVSPARGAAAARARAGRCLAGGTGFGLGRHTDHLVFLLVFLTWQTIYSANRDLVRAKEWGELARRALPFGALLLMALSLFIVQTYRENWVSVDLDGRLGAGIVAATLLSVSSLERGASRAFRKGDYSKAAELYEQLAEEKPLARNQALERRSGPRSVTTSP